ncbi:MAG: 2-amino-4-hydroxy-6-hydroxymethyldihydropteridine diphosphokinase [Candidatus Geothermincolia bacterium]
MSRAYIGMGSNMGDRAEYLKAGLSALMRTAPDIIVVGKSSIYESQPVGMTDQPDFFNAVVAVETTIGPHELLERLQAIEIENGRQRITRWGPRTLDLDILLFGDLEQDDPDLTVPHPRLKERRFVLEPLLEIEPLAALPDGTSLRSLLDVMDDDQPAWVTGKL